MIVHHKSNAIDRTKPYRMVQLPHADKMTARPAQNLLKFGGEGLHISSVSPRLRNQCADESVFRSVGYVR